MFFDKFCITDSLESLKTDSKNCFWICSENLYWGSFNKCKSQLSILIHVFPILLKEKVPPHYFFADFRERKPSWDLSLIHI